jgi:hypothetical protein
MHKNPCIHILLGVQTHETSVWAVLIENGAKRCGMELGTCSDAIAKLLLTVEH